MKQLRIRLVASTVALLAAGAAYADNAYIQQYNNSNSEAGINQVAGSAQNWGSVYQNAGDSNKGFIDQQPGSGPQQAWVTQLGGASSEGRVMQGGTASAGSVLGNVYQSNVFDSRGTVTQFNQVAGPGFAEVAQNDGGTLVGLVEQDHTTYSYGLVVQTGHDNNARVSQLGALAPWARVDQSGLDNTATVDQVGGHNNSMSINQGTAWLDGMYWARGVQVAAFTSAPTAPTSSSTANARQSGDTETGYIIQYGSSLHADFTQTGHNNLGGVVQLGAANSAWLNQFGGFGTATISQKGTGAFASIQQGGVNNVATITQQ